MTLGGARSSRCDVGSWLYRPRTGFRIGVRALRTVMSPLSSYGIAPRVSFWRRGTRIIAAEIGPYQLRRVTLFPASMESFITSMLIKVNIVILGTLSYQIPKICGVSFDFISGRDAYAHLKLVHERR
jgi:hypothetical protein